ncbi:MAG: type I 3-dehydroquinate dehydratase [Lachnospiraceae bacterium]|nr:type I 3-dehydroquinate dehydratase [Lachnospiraceae bacterium]
MKKTFTLKCGTFGMGKTKVCVPIVAEKQEEIWEKAEEIQSLSVDLVEWRVDFYEDVFSIEKVLETLAGLKERLKDKDILFTFRTMGEGGNLAVEKDAYYELNQAAASSGCVSLVDLELYFDTDRTADEIQKLHTAGSRVIVSNHDFFKTPTVEEMTGRLRKMEEVGADVAKLAVMPKCRQDVLKLLQASLMADEEISIPLVTMSMGEMGEISRVAGRLTGSAMTFACVGEASAPGQIAAEKMTVILEVL